MKGKLKIFLALIASVLCFGMAIACDEPTDPPAHEHTYATEWSTDATHHWHAATCEHTDEVEDKAEHTLTETVITAPTYLAKGKAKKVCSCGYETAEYDLEKKAQENPVYTLPTDLEGYFGETLADIELPEGFSFVDELTTELNEIGEKTFTVKYIAPNDTEGKYKVVEGLEVTVLVNKARPEYTVPTGLTATYGTLLSNVGFTPATNGEWAWENTDGSLTVGSVGEQTFNAVFTPFDNGYATVTEEVTVEVTAKPLTSGIQTITSKVYTGSQITPEVVIKDGAVELVNGTDYTLTYGDNLTVAQGGSVTVVLKGNYSGTLNANFEITAKPLTSGIQTITSKVYTGSQITPTVIVKDGETTLVEGTDYNAPVFANNTDKGTATVTLVLKGNYSGTLSQSFEIIAKALNSGIQAISAQTYTGSQITPAIVVKDGTKTLTKDTDYTVSYGANLNVSTGGSVTVTFKGNYSGNATANFDITAKALSSGIQAISAQTYTGSQITPAIVVKDGTKTLTKDTDYTVSYGANLNVSTGGSVTVVLKGNYLGTLTANFTISKKQIAKPSAPATKTFGYDGAIKTYDIEESSYYTVSGNTQTNAGTYTVTVTLKNQANLEWVGGGVANVEFNDFLIETAKVVKPVADETVFTYNGKAQIYELDDGDYYSVSGAIQTNAGTYTVKAVLEDTTNYEWVGGGIADVEFEFIIYAYTLTETDLVLSGTNLTYNGANQKPTATVASFLKASDYTLTNNGGTNVGNYSVTLAFASANVTGTITKNYEIKAKTLNSGIQTIATQVYSAEDKTPEVVVKDGETTLTKTTDYTVAYANNKNAGTATVTVTFTGNYAGTAIGTFEIEKKDLTNENVDVTVNGTYVYNGATHTPDLTVIFGVEELENGVDYTVSSESVNAGVATLMITFKGNYDGEKDESFEIAKYDISNAEITVPTNLKFNGIKGVTPTPTVMASFGKIDLTDFTIEYENNRDITVYGDDDSTCKDDYGVGTVTVTAPSDGNFSGNVNTTFNFYNTTVEKTLDSDDSDWADYEGNEAVIYTINEAGKTQYDVVVRVWWGSDGIYIFAVAHHAKSTITAPIANGGQNTDSGIALEFAYATEKEEKISGDNYIVKAGNKYFSQTMATSGLHSYKVTGEEGNYTTKIEAFLPNSNFNNTTYVDVENGTMKAGFDLRVGISWRDSADKQKIYYESLTESATWHTVLRQASLPGSDALANNADCLEYTWYIDEPSATINRGLRSSKYTSAERAIDGNLSDWASFDDAIDGGTLAKGKHEQTKVSSVENAEKTIITRGYWGSDGFYLSVDAITDQFIYGNLAKDKTPSNSTRHVNTCLEIALLRFFTEGLSTDDQTSLKKALGTQLTVFYGGNTTTVDATFGGEKGIVESCWKTEKVGEQYHHQVEVFIPMAVWERDYKIYKTWWDENKAGTDYSLSETDYFVSRCAFGCTSADTTSSGQVTEKFGNSNYATNYAGGLGTYFENAGNLFITANE